APLGAALLRAGRRRGRSLATIDLFSPRTSAAAYVLRGGGGEPACAVGRAACGRAHVGARLGRGEGRMIQRSTLLCLLLAMLSGYALFHMTDRAQRLEEELARLGREIAEDREAIHVLRAEWAYLNQPAERRAL